MMRGIAVLVIGWACCFGPCVHAEANVSGPSIEQRTTKLAEVLRCLVCQNQSIADSNAPLANDLKRQIREQVAQGRTDGEILDYMVARYGDFVLYRPPLKASTFMLWAGPFVALMIGFFLLVWNLRRGKNEMLQVGDDDRRRAAIALGRTTERCEP